MVVSANSEMAHHKTQYESIITALYKQLKGIYLNTGRAVHEKFIAKT